MHTLNLVTNYSGNDTYREKLYPLFEKVFNIEATLLKDYYQRGFWNPTYSPFTFFKGDQAIANVSMFTLPVVINNKYKKVAAIQSVMTDPAYRSIGLMKQLFLEMLEKTGNEFECSVLFTEIPDLYKPFGFEEVQEHYFSTQYEYVPGKEVSLQKLDFFNEKHLKIVKQCFSNHKPVSQQFAPLAYESSFYLNMYNPYFNEKLYYSKELNIIIVFEVKGESLKLYDVIGKQLPPLDLLCKQIPHPFSQIEFHFNPDQFNITDISATKSKNTAKMMVRGSLELNCDYLKFPITAKF
jgi:predicted N-acetyltransferase YhbS